MYLRRRNKILQGKLVFTGMRFGYGQYFFKKTGQIVGKFNDFILGTFNGESFGCNCKSGSQNLWLPFKQYVGLKIMHPKRYSGGLEKAQTHYKAQEMLAKIGLAPKVLEMLKLEISCVGCDTGMTSKGEMFLKTTENFVIEKPCYGIMMNRVLSGGVTPILRNLKLFGVENNKQTHDIVASFVTWYGNDALTLHDYAILCRFFGVSATKYWNEIVNDLKNSMPLIMSNSPDLLSPANIVLNQNGEAKVIDFDLSGL